MRIIHAFHTYYPVVGGMERAVQGLAEGQSRLGNEVHVLTSRYGNRGVPWDEVRNGVHICRIPSIKVAFPDVTVPLGIPKGLLRIADMVHVHGQNSYFCMQSLLSATALGTRTACYFMALDALADHPVRVIRYFGSVYGRRNTVRASRLSNIAFVKNTRDKELLHTEYDCDSILLPDGVPTSYFATGKSDPTQNSESFGIRQDQYVIFMGRMHKLKGPDVLVGALQFLDKGIAAVFIGPDSGFLAETQSLARKLGVRDRVYYFGYVNEQTKLGLLDSSISLVIPSIADYVEVYPMVISEAWARKKAVIGSRVGGVPFRITDRINGLLVHPKDAIQLADRITELSENPGFARRLGLNGRSHVSSWDAVAKDSVDCYRGLR